MGGFLFVGKQNGPKVFSSPRDVHRGVSVKMQPSQGILKLCESWWKKAADSNREEQYLFAEKFLGLLGWQVPSPVALPGSSLGGSVIAYLLQGASGENVAAHFVMPGILEPPSGVIERGLDFCDTTLALVTGSRALHVNYAWITDFFRGYLYDVRTEELLLCADAPTDLARDFSAVLARHQVEQGSLEEVRRQPRSYLSRQLREWYRRWHKVLIAQCGQPEEAVALATDRLILLRYLVTHDVLKRSGWSLQERFRELMAVACTSDGHGCGKRLAALFAALRTGWKAEYFAAVPYVDVVLEKDSVAAPLLREFRLLSPAKFTVPTILESFNYGEAAEKARVRMVPEEDEDRRMLLARQTMAGIDEARIEVDLSDEGYRAILFWLDRLVDTYERVERETDTDHGARRGPSEDMDLFVWSERDAARPRAFADKFRHAVEEALVVYHTTERQRRVAQLLLHLHLVQRHYEARMRLLEFPNVRAALRERPRLLESDRRQIYEPARMEEWEVM